MSVVISVPAVLKFGKSPHLERHTRIHTPNSETLYLRM
jgi:hypothetical protein